jgi:hypothetical protein
MDSSQKTISKKRLKDEGAQEKIKDLNLNKSP